jgi:hypothetical protein
MAEKWTIQESQARTVGETPCWEVALLKPDGTLHRHRLPTVALEWRAAEYGIDPADTDALLEIILHEPHLPMVDDEILGPRYADNGPDLWEADNTDTAREAHLARIKASPVRIDVKGVKALDPVRNGHQPDTDRIRKMREQVDTSRWIKKHGDLPKQPIPQDPAGKKEAARA